ncbi:hypothetical protein KIN20_015904 [Parelaphostrongylus tenuis]|uniref:Uncharacterized protein n=1 Tax=Parelaphostrongylus tenuis TaxID=148309 RepID=A0AAD5MKG8_PARTN|nr:hypothetical protein KIN20_015904 [Parelaphostrongylus tenuis]
MFVSVASLSQLAEKLSVKAVTCEFDAARSWLQRTASSRTLSQEERRVYYGERPWICAPKLVADGQANGFSARPNGLIRWLEHPERNCNIEFDADDNLYTVQVKAVYYAIANAMFHRLSHAVIYSPNEIIVKVGNGIYKARKEAGLYKGIQRKTAINEDNSDTCIRLCLLDDDALTRLKLSRESALSRENVPLCSEYLFRERHGSEILRL